MRGLIHCPVSEKLTGHEMAPTLQETFEYLNISSDFDGAIYSLLLYAWLYPVRKIDTSVNLQNIKLEKTGGYAQAMKLRSMSALNG